MNPKVAEVKFVTRPTTDAEKAPLLAHAEELLAMAGQPGIRQDLATKYRINAKKAQQRADVLRVAETQTVYRPMTAEEIEQRGVDAQDDQEREEQEAAALEHKVELVLAAAGKLGITPAEYLVLHPVPGLRPEDIENV